MWLAMEDMRDYEPQFLTLLYIKLTVLYNKQKKTVNKL